MTSLNFQNGSVTERMNRNFEINKALKFWLYQIFGWIPFFFSQHVLFGDVSFISKASLCFSTLVTASAISFTLCLRLFYKRLLGANYQGGLLFCCVVIASLLFALVSDAFFHLALSLLALLPLALANLAAEQPLFSSAPFIFLNYLAWSGLYLLVKRQEQVRCETIKNQQVELLLKESEVKNLQAQLNPHFLFNTLNNIRALVLLDGEKAREALYILADMMRYQVNYDNNDTINIGTELQFVQHYVSLAELQFGKRLRYQEQIDAPLLGVSVPRFAIQLLVENAIKHGFKTPQEHYDLRVDIAGSQHQWSIVVSNSGALLAKTNQGVGLANLQKRLAFLFGDCVVFTVAETAGMVVAKIEYTKRQ